MLAASAMRYKENQEKDLLSVFVVKRDDTFVFPLLRAWLKLCVLVGPIVLFLIFHVVHVSFGSTASDNSWKYVTCLCSTGNALNPERKCGRGNVFVGCTFLCNGLRQRRVAKLPETMSKWNLNKSPWPTEYYFKSRSRGPLLFTCRKSHSMPTDWYLFGRMKL